MKQQRKKEKISFKTKKESPDYRRHQDSTITSHQNLKPKGNEQLPTIQNMLEIPKENRANKTFQYFKKVKPFMNSYILKKQGSRAVQLMFKWGNAEIKSQIYKIIIKNWKELIKSSYALHVISKVSVEFQLPRLVEDAISLQNNKQGSMVIQQFISKNPNSPKTSQIYRKFQQIFRQAQQKGPQSQQILHNLAVKSLQKSYYGNKLSKLIMRLALPTMFDEQKQKTIEFFSQRSLQLLTDQEGVKLFIYLFNFYDSKEKKSIVMKQFKGQIGQILSMSALSYVAIIKVLTEIDDTVMVGNKLIPELLQHLNLLQDQNSKLYNVLISMLSPRNNNFNCLGKVERTVEFTYCKKPEQTRKQQIRQFIYPALADYLTSNNVIDKTCNSANHSRLALGLIKSMKTDGSQQLKTFATKLIKNFIANLQEAKADGFKNIVIQNTLVANPFGSKLIKNILFLQETFIDKFCDRFSELFQSNLEKALYSNASFVITVLIQKGRNELIQELKRLKVDMQKVKAKQFYETRLKLKKK